MSKLPTWQKVQKPKPRRDVPPWAASDSAAPEKTTSEGLTTKARSLNQERAVAALVKGRLTPNSGGTFGENDVISSDFEFECKTTQASSYSLKMAELEKLESRCASNKTPVFVIDFEQAGKRVAVLDFNDYLNLINHES